MKRFIVIEDVAKFCEGTVYLTGFQYQPRANFLERVSPGYGKFGEYKILAPIEFVRGEIIGYDGTAHEGIKELTKEKATVSHSSIEKTTTGILDNVKDSVNDSSEAPKIRKNFKSEKKRKRNNTK